MEKQGDNGYHQPLGGAPPAFIQRSALVVGVKLTPSTEYNDCNTNTTLSTLVKKPQDMTSSSSFQTVAEFGREILSSSAPDWLLKIIRRTTAMRKRSKGVFVISFGGGYDLIVLLEGADLPKDLSKIPRTNVALSITTKTEEAKRGPNDLLGVTNHNDNIWDHVDAMASISSTANDVLIFLSDNTAPYGAYEGRKDRFEVIRLWTQPKGLFDVARIDHSKKLAAASSSHDAASLPGNWDDLKTDDSETHPEVALEPEKDVTTKSASVTSGAKPSSNKPAHPKDPVNSKAKEETQDSGKISKKAGRPKGAKNKPKDLSTKPKDNPGVAALKVSSPPPPAVKTKAPGAGMSPSSKEKAGNKTEASKSVERGVASVPKGTPAAKQTAVSHAKVKAEATAADSKPGSTAETVKQTSNALKSSENKPQTAADKARASPKKASTDKAKTSTDIVKTTTNTVNAPAEGEVPPKMKGGRPKGSKNKPKPVDGEVPPQKTPGRPKGSKNKTPKTATTALSPVVKSEDVQTPPAKKRSHSKGSKSTPLSKEHATPSTTKDGEPQAKRSKS